MWMDLWEVEGGQTRQAQGARVLGSSDPAVALMVLVAAVALCNNVLS